MFHLTSRPRPLPPIQLNLPKGWNSLTTEQVEGVCRILIDGAKKQTATGSFTQIELMTRVFFLLSGLEITGGPFEDENAEDEIDRDANRWFECQYADKTVRARRQSHGGKILPIKITVAEIQLLTIGHHELKGEDKITLVPGPLGWILGRSELTIFPYPTLTLPDTQVKSRKPQSVTLQGPNPLMDGTSWRQYRTTADLVHYLQRAENNLINMRRNSLRYSSETIRRQEGIVDDVRCQLLANIFLRSIPHIDPETGQQTTGYFYTSSQLSDNAYLFRGFPDEKFQAILLWWQGMMGYLSKQFPKVFRTNKEVGKQTGSDDPLRLYTRSITTMIKYAAESEEEVNRTTYTVILQHMQDMADENDRIRDIKKRH